MLKPFAFTVAFVVAVPTLAQIPESADPAAIPNYKILKPGLATAGQPSPEALKKLKEQGFKTVINLRAESEPGVKEEEEIVKALGLQYVSVPITPATLSQEKVDQVAKALDDAAAGPILLHCGSANRVGAVWTVIQAQRGKSYEEAEAEGRKIGLTSPVLVEAVKKLLAPKPEGR
jgi:uncharacterized protein (TIGR01244 family)